MTHLECRITSEHNTETLIQCCTVVLKKYTKKNFHPPADIRFYEFNLIFLLLRFFFDESIYENIKINVLRNSQVLRRSGKNFKEK